MMMTDMEMKHSGDADKNFVMLMDPGDPGRSDLGRKFGLSLRSTQHFHDFGDLFPLVALVAACNGVLDTVGDVIAKDHFLGATQRRSHRRDLRCDIDAVAILLDHPGQPTDLPFYAPEPSQYGGSGILLHA